MEPEGRIPFVAVAGSHREVGRQLGAASAAAIAAAVDFDRLLRAGRSRAGQLQLAGRYREATRAATPWLVDEIDGAAEGADVDPLALFAASVEEIWSSTTAGPGSRGAAAGAGRAAMSAAVGGLVRGRCSDLVLGPPWTADGHLWVAHTNDLAPDDERALVAVEWRVPGEPVVFSIGCGPWISVGWNDAGLSLTGNELSPNDERVGVPRLLMVRQQLTAGSLDEAVAMTLRADRASSYNTVLAHRDGRAVNVEGSATAAVVRDLEPGGTLAHTNHYVEPEMLRYENDPAYAGRSSVRYRRACGLLASAVAGPPGAVTPDRLRAWLSDHDGAPDSICRHPSAEPDGPTTKTVFWCLADVTAGEVRYGRGNPCAGLPEARHHFA
jgi:isopenicillin-N N-acyltransferase-like protein